VNPSVILTCTSYHKAELPNNGMFELGPGGGSIGRDPSCDIVLPDPQKMLSRCHAKIISSGTDVIVVDTSSNGLFVNGAQSPLGRGGSIQLRDGMQLSFGDLVFSVSLGHVTHQQPEFELQAPPSAMPEPEHPLSNASGATPQEASQPHPQSFNDPSASGPVAPALAEPVQHPAHAPEVPAAASPVAPSSESSAHAGNSSPVAVQTYTDGMPTADSAFEELVLKGLMDLLAARAELKNELRMSATLIAQAENNPLKFAANVAAAKVLFAEVSKNTAYLTRTEAVTQAMAEIQEHQTALTAGMREAFKQMLKTFAPENFEEKQGAGLGKIVSSPEKQAWVAYKKFYADRVSQSDDPFQDLFSAALTRAYLSALNED